MKIYGQRDDRWKNEKLGTSNKTIGSHGCVLSCLAMASGLTPSEVNQKMKDVNGFFSGNLVIWSKIKEAIPSLEWEYRGWEYDNAKVKQAIDDNGFCLVEVDGSRIGGDRHWVVYIGNQQMLDPWYSNQKTTNYYRPTGFSVIKKRKDVIQENQETEQLKKKLTECQNTLDHERQQIKNYREQVDGALKDIGELKQKKASLQSVILEMEVDLKEEQSARKDDLQKIAEKLKCSDDLVEILKGVEKLLVKEDGLEKCLDDKRKCSEKLAQEATKHGKTLEELSVRSGISVASYKGVKKALQAYANLQDKKQKSEIEDYNYIIKLKGYTLWKK